MSDPDLRDQSDAVDNANDADADVAKADAGPIDEDAMQAADGLTASKETEEHYTEMVERGANTEGEGRVP